MIIVHWKKAFILSAVLVLLSIGFIVYHMATDGLGTLGLNLGIDFAGGVVLQLNLGEEYKMEDVREILAGHGLRDASLQRVRVRGDDGELKEEGVLIKAPIVDDAVRDAILDDFRDKWPELNPEDKRVESVGGAVGQEQKKWSGIALAVALAAMIAYITLRFEFRFAIATIVALIHDVIIIMGVFSIFRIEANLPFVAAMLTIIGYSVNDSIIIIDRIRENMKYKRKKEDLTELVNRSIMQTLARCINTALTTLMVLTAMMIGFYYFIGNLDLIAFVIAMILGVIVGAFSSIFVVSPLWLIWKKREFKTVS